MKLFRVSVPEVIVEAEDEASAIRVIDRALDIACNSGGPPGILTWSDYDGAGRIPKAAVLERYDDEGTVEVLERYDDEGVLR